ncbi:MAG: hypothetical protein AVDCRST_MAG78-43, partial [uncultured Rubrobacteraceae bacterium]
WTLIRTMRISTLKGWITRPAKRISSLPPRATAPPMPWWTGSGPWAGPSSPARRMSSRNYTLLPNQP